MSPVSQPSPIRCGIVRTTSAAVPSEDKGLNECFIGIVDTGDEQLRAYIKVLTDKELVNELLSASIGRACGLPIPEPLLARASAAELPGSSLLSKHPGYYPVFASVDAGLPSLKRKLRSTAGSYHEQFFNSWEHRDETIIFDEWVANIDRNIGNILVETRKRAYLIDHGQAFTGPAWDARELSATADYENKLANHIFPHFTLPARMAARSAAADMQAVFLALDCAKAASACHLQHLMSAADLDAMVSFIMDRAAEVHDKISDKLGIPNMPASAKTTS